MQEKLEALYNNVSKHSNYQVLSTLITDKIDLKGIKTNSRYEKERFSYIINNLDIIDKNILDIGGNTGFFTFESIKNGAKNVTYVEGNHEHAKFVEEVSEILNVNNIRVINKYYDFNNLSNEKYDIVFLLNVLHHIGDDFDDNNINILNAKKQILLYLNNISNISDYIVFQLGFNWKGNRDICLFEHGEKAELIDYIRNGTKDNWQIEKIGINDGNKYVDLDDSNIGRINELGEFRNRPLFIMKSKKTR